jgi:hypothetical protein
MKKIISLVMLLVSLATANAKCDWSTLKLQQSNNRNYYKWYVSGRVLDDTCVDYMFMVYDFQTKKTDTVYDNKGICEVQFNKKGKYKMYLKVWNRCEKCDTALYREVIIQYFNKVSFSKTAKSCKNFIYEMSPATFIKGDTCYSYYYYIYSGRFFDNLTKGEWDSITMNQLYTFYDFPESDLDTFHESRLFNYTYPKNGRYLIISQVFNWCNYQDTFMMSKVTIDCNSSGVKDIVKNEDIKVIGYYDMIGRKVEYMEVDKPYVIIYSNGKRQKVIRTK